MSKFYILCIKFMRFFLFIVFFTFTVVSLFIKPIYNYDDSPGFVSMTPEIFIYVLLGALGLIFLLKYRIVINKISKSWLITIIYIFLGMIFIILVPLKPFSDMEQIFRAAIEVSQFNFSYFSDSIYFRLCPNNVLVSFLYGLLFMAFPKDIIVFKILNIICILLIAQISTRLVSLYYNKYSNLFYLSFLSFGSVFLYINHIYTDIPFTLVSLIAIYLYLKNSNKPVLPIFLLVLLYFIRAVAVIYIIAILLDYFFTYKSNIGSKLKIIFFIFIMCFLMFFGINSLIKSMVNYQNGKESIPVWSYIYMGFNQDEFGFQDGTHSIDRNMKDVVERIRGYDVKEVTEIIAKKEYWMWMEGTYQAQRYAFGENSDESNSKFYYETAATKYLMNNEQTLRKVIDSFIYSQYFILFVLMLYWFVRPQSDKLSVIYLVYMGMFLFYVFWEIKSRYIISLYPFMMIFSIWTLLSLQTNKKGE
ncbi:hypothetical protein LI142_20495 [Eubacterium limosum]|uniref:Glycosyltransferase RgtA/B/C/D-like domain-containing protein n=1 Tax=Eubacterium limosum TaxID=1736 RepID=A0ABT5UUR2_EUBLI|nr:hypothetical protein [Eubacterium limosum]MCB6571883.1 hypothetical protein [Eubacterium limosum]MDE1472695.1 hypothetical protein [Eubacterium limosum]